MKTKKHIRFNPAYLKNTNSRAWVLAGKCVRENICHDGMMKMAHKLEPDTSLAIDTENARRELGYRQNDRRTNLKKRIAERLPVRPNLRAVPFYLRPHYEMYPGSSVGTTYIPRRDFGNCKNDYSYQPIIDIEARLITKRYQLMRTVLNGLVRWTETIERSKCSFTITKSFDDFYFKIDAGTSGNRLPVTKIYSSMGIHVRAPHEFFNQPFWGLGEHLVVQVLEKYTTDAGVNVTRTLSCDRDNLYDLNSPNELKERFYVKADNLVGTGLTVTAALKSLHYTMSKEITKYLGESNGI